MEVVVKHFCVFFHQSISTHDKMDSRVFQETGPDEDFQTIPKKSKSKVIDDESQPVGGTLDSGVFKVERDNPLIEEFLVNVHVLTKRDETFGLIWDECLNPSGNRYSKGDNYSSIGEATKLNNRNSVSFYRDGATGKKFAMKTVPISSFRKEEVLIGLKNQHPNICRVYGIILHDGFVHILQEYAGVPLTEARDWITENPSRMLSFARQIFEALAALHKYGYVHCDIKPDNIMISDDAEGMGFTVKLIDYGSCQRTGTPLSENCYTTKLYWSPEIWQAVDNKNEIICLPDLDIYALALTFYFVNTSHHLMQKFDDQRKLMTERPDDLVVIALPETIPLELRIIMKQCLAGKPRLTADQGVKQLNQETTKLQIAAHPNEENYRDSFSKILHGSKRMEITKTLTSDAGYHLSPFSAQATDHNSVRYFVGSSKGIEKREREFKTSAKGKHASASGSRFSKPPVKKITNMQYISSAVSNNNTLINRSAVANPFPSSELDVNSYACSNLLKHIALQVQPDTYRQDLLPQTSFSSHVKNSCQKIEAACVENDSTASTVDKKVSKTGQIARHNEDGITSKKPTLKGKRNIVERQIKHKFKSNNEKGAVGKTGKFVDSMACEPPDMEINQLSELNTQRITSYQKPEQNETLGGECGDDMAYLLSVIDKGVNSEDEILDNWLRYLDNNEQTMEVENNPKQSSDHAEPMEACNDHNVCASENNNVNMIAPSVNLQMRGSRKRIAESIPDPGRNAGKVAFSSQQLDANNQQLPNFDQILSESP